MALLWLGGVSWFVCNVGFVPFGWFLLALTLLFIAALLSRPYAVVDALLMPIILALTIGLMIYLTLATTKSTTCNHQGTIKEARSPWG